MLLGRVLSGRDYGRSAAAPLYMGTVCGSHHVTAERKSPARRKQRWAPGKFVNRPLHFWRLRGVYCAALNCANHCARHFRYPEPVV